MTTTHRRKNLRLSGYDYSLPGAYFVTIVTHNRAPLFGEVGGDYVRLSEQGQMIERFWQEVPKKFPTAELFAYVVMPNHLHGIVLLNERPDEEGGHTGPPLHAIIDWFKTMTTNAYYRAVKAGRAAELERRLWQRSFYDRVIRGDTEWERITNYIHANPVRWAEDKENPENVVNRAGT